MILKPLMPIISYTPDVQGFQRGFFNLCGGGDYRIREPDAVGFAKIALIKPPGPGDFRSDGNNGKKRNKILKSGLLVTAPYPGKGNSGNSLCISAVNGHGAGFRDAPQQPKKIDLTA
jgi:hypothetical protein